MRPCLENRHREPFGIRRKDKRIRIGESRELFFSEERPGKDEISAVESQARRERLDLAGMPAVVPARNGEKPRVSNLRGAGPQPGPGMHQLSNPLPRSQAPQ